MAPGTGGKGGARDGGAQGEPGTGTTAGPRDGGARGGAGVGRVGLNIWGAPPYLGLGAGEGSVLVLEGLRHPLLK